MDSMGQHSADELRAAAGGPLRRAHVAAWSVFLGMAGTSMAFQTYHALHFGKMPWPLAYLYGIVPLGISIGVLMFAAVWPSRWARAGAYAVTAGAMYLSAAATGAVSQSAAPSHGSLLFGGLLDGAALLAVHFIFDGPTAGQAVAAVARKVAELTAAAEAERSLRGQAETGREHERTGLQAELAETRRAAEAQMAEARRVHQVTVSVLEERVNDARSEAEAASARAEVLTRKLKGATGGGRAGNGTRKQGGDSARKPEPVPAEAGPGNPDDLPGNWDALDTEARVLVLVNEKGYSASKAGVAAGVTDARGRQIVRLAKGLTGTAPQEVVRENPEA